VCRTEVIPYAPVAKPKDDTRDRYQPLPDDSEAVAAWRQRMGTQDAKTIYKERAATAECVNAIARNRGLTAVGRAWSGESQNGLIVVCACA